jgi:MOSC domain-containing protein YiiM
MVTHLLIAMARGAPMTSLHSVQALAGQGLSGDRYANPAHRRSPDYQVTLIELENIESFVVTTGLVLTPEMPRRNVITRGVNLNRLVGKCFTVGPVTLEGLELCEPCSLFAKRTHREVLKFFIGKGGLRARIVTGGEVHIGDCVTHDA